MYTLKDLETAFNAGRSLVKSKDSTNYFYWKTFKHFIEGIKYDSNYGYHKADNGLNK